MLKKLLKIIIAIIGACNAVFSIFTPIALVLLLIINFNSSVIGKYLLIIIAILSTIYRAISIGFLSAKPYGRTATRNE